jgi:integrase/recombinase XerD
MADDANRLANACTSATERLIIFTLLDTGLRVAELAKLTRGDVDWQNHRLIIFGKGGPFGSKSKRRVVPLTPRVRALLEAHLAVHESIGMTARTIQRLVKRVAVRSGVTKKISPHVLRHTFAVACVQKNISLPALQKVLGHDNLETTQIYLNLSPEHVLAEYQAKWGAA